MNRKIISLLMIFASACSSADLVDTNVSVTSESLIELSTIELINTRGEPVNSQDAMGSIGLYCAFTGGESWSSSTKFEKMSNSRFDFLDEEWVAADGDVPWGFDSFSDKYTFFAYSPYDGAAKGITSRLVEGELVIDYVVPINSVDQPDLMLAEPLKDKTPQVAGYLSLNFHHTLCCVSFGVSSSVEDRIVGVSINGVVADGSVWWDYAAGAPKWSLGDVTDETDETDETYVVEVDLNYDLAASDFAQVNTQQGYLMMIPQSLPDGAEVVLTLESGEQRSLMIPRGSKWEAGLMYQYLIDKDIESSEFIFTSDEVSNCYIINPTPNKQTVIQIPIEDRINDFWLNYSSDSSNKIKNKTSPDDIYVDMVWHDFDEPFEFTYDVFDDENESMAVELVVPSKFQEGNFVFVVYEYVTKSGSTSKSALWSWHLWFTDYNPDAIAAANLKNIKAGEDMAYTLTGYQGAVHRYKDAEGAANSACVWSGIYNDKFIMDRNIGERNEYAGDYGAGTVYYEFGRKDPFPGNAATYLSGDTQPSVRSSTGFTFDDSVEYYDDYMASSSSVSGNWSIEPAARLFQCIWFDETLLVSDYDTGKSIFDPSPLGWRVPVSDTWSYLNSFSSCDTFSTVATYNYYGYRDPYNAAKPSQGGVEASVWSANPDNSYYSYCLLYTTSQIVSPSSKKMVYALPVRAIQE